MSDYTPTTKEIIEHWSAVRGQAIDPAARDRPLERAEMFRRWLAARDAEKRAEWEAEQGEVEWEHGVGYFGDRGDIARFSSAAVADEAANLRLGDVRLRRRKAGPWVAANENGETP